MLTDDFKKRLRWFFRDVVIAMLLPAWFTLFPLDGPLVRAEEPQRDLTDLSLEELMELDVFSVNVLGTHTHLEDEWMLGYRYMFMEMDGNQDGSREISDTDVLKNFMVAPTNMTTQMHMISVMHGLSDDLTLMAMLPYIRKSMDHITRTGVRFTTDSEGAGDLKLSANYTFYGNVQRDAFHATPWGPHRFILDMGLSIPTGSIDEQDFLANPAIGRQQLPYPMQLGSGTFDLVPGMTYLGQSENWAWMAEAMLTLRLGKNSNDYRLGNLYHMSAWVSRRVTDALSLFVEVDGHILENIEGADPALDPKMVPTADPGRRGGKSLDLSVGVNLYVPADEVNKGHRMVIEGGFPLYDSLDGPQLDMAWILRIGWARTF